MGFIKKIIDGIQKHSEEYDALRLAIELKENNADFRNVSVIDLQQAIMSKSTKYLKDL
jgi:hypothetical protein